MGSFTDYTLAAPCARSIGCCGLAGALRILTDTPIGGNIAPGNAGWGARHGTGNECVGLLIYARARAFKVLGAYCNSCTPNEGWR